MTINTILFAESNLKPAASQPDEQICIANISPLERQKRMRFGVMQFVITLVILGALVVSGVNHFWRLPLLIMFWGATTGYFQAKDKT